MSGKAGTLELLAQQVGLALQPLEALLTSDNILFLLAQLGLQFPSNLLQPNFVTALNTAATAVGALEPTLAQLQTAITNDDEAGTISDGLKLIDEIGALLSALPQIATELKNMAGSLPGMNSSE